MNHKIKFTSLDCNGNLVDWFTRLDKLGGWPLEYKFVAYAHMLGDRDFSNDYRHNEWRTTFASSDDYYLWKLSPLAKERFKNECRSEFARQVARMA